MDEFRVDGWLIAPGRNTISKGTRAQKLEPRVMDLLVYFATHPNQVLSRDQILENVWPHRFVSDSTLETAVSALRRAFGDSPGCSKPFPSAATA
ncbi:MAG: winged helix-turn-helix domain-containing protein [Pseudomonadales bacterium]|nr:winged helix-turn-helix domain-containing protein [Pseudomonadales bacterium]